MKKQNKKTKRSGTKHGARKKKHKRVGKKPLGQSPPLIKTKTHAPYRKDKNGNYKPVFSARKKSGVYLIYKNGNLRYVGYSRTDLYKTMYRHFQEWNDQTQHRTLYKHLQGVTVRVVYTNNGITAQRLEQALILKYRPADNLNKYEQYEADEKDKARLKEFNEAPFGIVQYEGPDPF